MKREEALAAVEPLFEACLRALHFAPADKPSLEVLREMSSVHENGLRAAIALAYQAGYEQRDVFRQLPTQEERRDLAILLLNKDGFYPMLFSAADEAAARERFRVARERGLSEAEAQAEGWPDPAVLIAERDRLEAAMPNAYQDGYDRRRAEEEGEHAARLRAYEGKEWTSFSPEQQIACLADFKRLADRFGAEASRLKGDLDKARELIADLEKVRDEVIGQRDKMATKYEGANEAAGRWLKAYEAATWAHDKYVIAQGGGPHDLERPEHVALLLRDGLANFHTIVAALAAKVAGPQLAEARRQFDQTIADQARQHRADTERAEDLLDEVRRQLCSFELDRLRDEAKIEALTTEVYDHTDPEVAAARRKYPLGAPVNWWLIAGSDEVPVQSNVRRMAWRLGHGTIVVSLVPVRGRSSAGIPLANITPVLGGES